MLEGDAANPLGEAARLFMKRLQPRVLHPVVATHLLDEQQRIGPDVDVASAVAPRPFECGDERAVLGHVVRGDADRLAEILE